jgi:hypothetical protein
LTGIFSFTLKTFFHFHVSFAVHWLVGLLRVMCFLLLLYLCFFLLLLLFICVFAFEMGSPYSTQTGLKPQVILPPASWVARTKGMYHCAWLAFLNDTLKFDNDACTYGFHLIYPVWDLLAFWIWKWIPFNKARKSHPFSIQVLGLPMFFFPLWSSSWIYGILLVCSLSSSLPSIVPHSWSHSAAFV